MENIEYVCDCNIIHKDKVEKATKNMPKIETFLKLSEFFKMLGDPTRMKILFSLDQNEMCVCDIANAVGMSKSAVSHQLALLKKINIVKFRKEGKEVYYTLDDEHVKEVFEVGLEHINEKEGEID